MKCFRHYPRRNVQTGSKLVPPSKSVSRPVSGRFLGHFDAGAGHSQRPLGSLWALEWGKWLLLGRHEVEDPLVEADSTGDSSRNFQRLRLTQLKSRLQFLSDPVFVPPAEE